MTILNILFFFTIFRLIGNKGRIPYLKYQINRGWIVGAAGLYLLLVLWDIPLAIAYMAVFAIIRLLPTQALFSAIRGTPPERKDRRWQFLQTITNAIKIKGQSWFAWGIDYGIIRMSLAIPAIIYIGNYWMFSLLGIGVVYYLAGTIERKYGLYDKAVTISECVVGAIYGACLI